jgi:hypothetical protein
MKDPGWESATLESQKKYPEKRGNRRANMARSLRVRPSNPRDPHFVDISVSINASKDGIYFATKRTSYYPGMRLFVTFPFTSAHDPMNCEYVAEVLRVDKLPKGKFGVAVNLKMTMNYPSGAPSNSGMHS